MDATRAEDQLHKDGKGSKLGKPEVRGEKVSPFGWKKKKKVIFEN